MEEEIIELKEEIKEPVARGIVTGSEVLKEGGIPLLRNKVAIVGFAPSTMKDVQYVWDDPDMEVWAINQLYAAFPEIVPRTTRWFQIHPRNSYDQNYGRDKGHHQWLTEQTLFPIYMDGRPPDVPCAIAFPTELILSKFRRYFTNSISWEIALAILEGFKEIHIFGVDMAQDGEYAFERPSVEYFIGLAEGAGIKVVIGEKSDLLFSTFVYPFESTSRLRTKMTTRRNELRARANQVYAQKNQMEQEHAAMIGALENMNYMERAWLNEANTK